MRNRHSDPCEGHHPSKRRTGPQAGSAIYVAQLTTTPRRTVIVLSLPCNVVRFFALVFCLTLVVVVDSPADSPVVVVALVVVVVVVGFCSPLVWENVPPACTTRCRAALWQHSHAARTPPRLESFVITGPPTRPVVPHPNQPRFRSRSRSPFPSSPGKTP